MFKPIFLEKLPNFFLQRNVIFCAWYDKKHDKRAENFLKKLGIIDSSCLQRKRKFWIISSYYFLHDFFEYFYWQGSNKSNTFSDTNLFSRTNSHLMNSDFNDRSTNARWLLCKTLRQFPAMISIEKLKIMTNIFQITFDIFLKKSFLHIFLFFVICCSKIFIRPNELGETMFKIKIKFFM